MNKMESLKQIPSSNYLQEYMELVNFKILQLQISIEDPNMHAPPVWGFLDASNVLKIGIRPETERGLTPTRNQN